MGPASACTPPSWQTGSRASSTMGSRAAAWVGRGSASGRKAARAPRNCARTCEPPARAARCNAIEPGDRSDLREYGRVDPYFIPSFKAKRRGYRRSVERFAHREWVRTPARNPAANGCRVRRPRPAGWPGRHRTSTDRDSLGNATAVVPRECNEISPLIRSPRRLVPTAWAVR